MILPNTQDGMERLEKIICLADANYPDGMIQAAWSIYKKRKTTSVGDTLAEFVIKELAETFDEDETWVSNLNTARQAMNRAANELIEVSACLDDAFELEANGWNGRDTGG